MKCPPSLPFAGARQSFHPLNLAWLDFTLPKQDLTLDTLVGPITFVVHTAPERNGAIVKVNLEAFPVQPHIPIAMSVRRLRAVMLDLSCEDDLAELTFEACLPAGLEGSPENGEHLDAQSVVNGQFVAALGTEDGPRLKGRMPWIQTVGEDDEWNLVHHKPNGLVISLGRVPAGQGVGLHFLIAENDYPEREDYSCWFAVDRFHEKLESERPQSRPL